MLVPCPECNHKIRQDATSCPNCGRPFAHEELARLVESKYKQGQKQQIGCLVFAAILGLLIWAAGRAGEHNVSAKGTERSSTTAATAQAPLVTKQRKVIVLCAYCGNKIRSETEPAEVRESDSPQPRREYAICSRKACQRAGKLRAKHSDWSASTCYTIAQRKVQIGMTKDQVLAAWGRPADINGTVTPFGASEQWCYGEIGGTYLYFEDGVMTSFQD